MREATRSLWSLGEAADILRSADGSVEFCILPVSKGSQGVGVVGASTAVVGLPLGFLASFAGHGAWMPWFFLAGILIGVVVAPRVIRRHPAVIFRMDREHLTLTAHGPATLPADAVTTPSFEYGTLTSHGLRNVAGPNANAANAAGPASPPSPASPAPARLARNEVARLILVTGNKLSAIPGSPDRFVGSDECRNGALLAVLSTDPSGDHAVLLYPHALPARALRTLARAAAEEWSLPLEELKF